MNQSMSQDIEQLIHDVLHGQATAEDVQRLSDWIASSKDNARVYYRVLSDERAIQRCLEQDAARAVDHVSEHPDDSAAGLVLAELAEAEANAEASVVEWVEIKDRRWRLGSMQYAWAAMIAIATLTAVVVMLLAGPKGSSTSSPFVEGPSQKVPTQTMERQAVATLSNTSNAQWAGRGLTLGSELRAGQRLVLTAGFAEITTQSGAVAILQAPATIEFIDSPNALRLHTGKLVGICATPSSKGFLVRTSHMDVTDLGTRFGVDASQPGLTEVHVFEGEVQAVRPGSLPVLLTAEQSARAVTGADRIAAIDHNPNRFAAIRNGSGLGVPHNKTALHIDTDGRPWLIAPSEHAGPIAFNGNEVACTVNNEAFGREIAQGNAYGFIQYRAASAGHGKPATAVGSWTLSNLPAGRYDVATAFEPKEGIHGGGDSIRYTVNGVGVAVDQSAVPAPDAGPTFTGGLSKHYQPRPVIHFTLIGSSVVVPEGGSITVTIDNANIPEDRMAIMDSIAISLVPEDQPD